ncbi:winged helix-turn-helix domain-containing protein [Raoultella terrigena]|uniref:winged helix-turn-helix domain-containing protein n=1 Tax=Raoultella terrigena TaxID=577 RepID=UPI001F522739|nr:winged helix-turn-helix domain-containing protein [Raoultella terrigena]MCI1032925.1 winged helix-turn-helix domain-containing protein [Raoultella terrigena]
MHRYYVINNTIEFHPTTRKLRNIITPTNMVVLNSPASRCLLLLIERSGTIVTQQEFMYNVWEKLGLVVSANTYYQNICLLRKGMKEIGFTSDPITTIPRIGLTLALDTQIQAMESTDPPASDNDDGQAADEAVLSASYEELNKADSGHASSPQETVESVADIPASAPNIPAPLYLQKRDVGRFSKLFFLITILIFSILLTDLKVIVTHFQDQRYFENYQLTVNTNGCHLFLNKDIHNTDERKKALNYGVQFKSDCQKFPWVYISRYAMLPRASVIRCNKPMSSPNYCISNYFIEDH